MYVGRPAVMVSAILAARHRTFLLVVTSLFVLFVFPMHNKCLLLLVMLSVDKRLNNLTYSECVRCIRVICDSLPIVLALLNAQTRFGRLLWLID